MRLLVLVTATTLEAEAVIAAEPPEYYKSPEAPAATDFVGCERERHSSKNPRGERSRTCWDRKPREQQRSRDPTATGEDSEEKSDKSHLTSLIYSYFNFKFQQIPNPKLIIGSSSNYAFT
ncbi:hypothetical protein PoB_005939200 [Plakobranchus ocellatus]|uniref:Secreted protein n=1 Tax=Plakobranchus ocellatus TaxID=259542 RepID=A0AAV4CMC2_9GAST|nr:hypothetical protein PoB_005939200 [Plakobranchus ocellatus]